MRRLKMHIIANRKKVEIDEDNDCFWLKFIWTIIIFCFSGPIGVFLILIFIKD